MIKQPFTMAHLPIPAKNHMGKVQASDVIAITELRKRKRSELALAIDGEAVNIYDVIYHIIERKMEIAERSLDTLSKARILLCCPS